MYYRKKKRGGSAQLRNMNSKKAKELSKVYENYLVKRENRRKELEADILRFRFLKNKYMEEYNDTMYSTYHGPRGFGSDFGGDLNLQTQSQEYERKEKEAMQALQQIPEDEKRLSRMLTRRILGKIHPLFSNSAFMNEIWKYTGNESPPRSATRKKATTT